MIQVHSIELPRVGENTYALVNERKEALLVDPGDQAEQIIAWISDQGWQPQAVLLTHGHLDHIGALDAIRDHYQIEAYIHHTEAEFLTNPQLNLSAYMGPKVIQRPAENLWQTTGAKQVAGFEFEIRHVPGHSPGSVIYIFAEDRFVISGDTVFRSSIGRTDFPGGSLDQLLSHIRQEILTLPGDFRLYPGHGPATDIQSEQVGNPFLQNN